MDRIKELQTIDWERLLREFSAFRAFREALETESAGYVASLVRPCHPFVGQFLTLRIEEGQPYHEAVRDLYHYLLQKRYNERLNLLHFAFHIFDDNTCLPHVIIDMTPFPHEDGIPKFQLFHDHSINLGGQFHDLPQRHPLSYVT